MEVNGGALIKMVNHVGGCSVALCSGNFNISTNRALVNSLHGNVA